MRGNRINLNGYQIIFGLEETHNYKINLLFFRNITFRVEIGSIFVISLTKI